MVLRRSVQGSLVVAGLLLLRCAPGTPGGIHPDEAEAFGISQGVVGRLAVRTGVCGTISSGCEVQRPPVSPLAVPADDGGFVMTGDGCRIGDEMTPLFGRRVSVPPTAIAGVTGEDTYAIATPVGQFSVLLVRDDCAICAQAVAVDAAHDECAATSVPEAALVTVDFTRDYSVDR